MRALHEFIKTANHESLTLDGVQDVLTEVGYKSPVSIEAALRIARGYLPYFTDEINDQIFLVGSFPQIQFTDRRNEKMPAINWGVVGVNYAAGTLAAMNALHQEAATAGFTSEVTPTTRLQEREYDSPLERAWFRFTVTGE